MKNKITFILKLIITVSLFGWLLKSNRIDFTLLAEIKYNHFFFLFIGSIFLHLVLQTIRWKFLLKFYSVNISLYQSFVISWIGNFFSLFLPGASSGEFVRGYYINKIDSGKISRCISSLIIDRALGVYIFIIYVFASCLYLFVRGYNSKLTLHIFIVSAVSFLILSLIFISFLSKIIYKRISNFIPNSIKIKFEDELHFQHQSNRFFFIATLFSVFSSFFAINGFFLSSYVLQKPISVYQAFLFTPIIIISNTLPISPGGLGVAETVSSLLFLQLNNNAGAEIMLLYRIGISLLRLPGGLIYLSATKLTKHKI